MNTMNYHNQLELFFQKDLEEYLKINAESSDRLILELFENTYRVLWSSQIGNRYDSEGILIALPRLSEDEYDQARGEILLDNAIEQIEQDLAIAID